jgi:PAS domain S-box-containing protein
MAISDLVTAPPAVVPHDHIVQFYEHEEALIARVAPFLRQGLESGAGAIAIMRPEHERLLREHWRAEGFDLGNSDRFICLDAAKTLASFTRDGWPQQDLFELHVGSLVESLHARCGSVVAFGEMVALLWAEGRRAAAVQLEALWNALGTRVNFSLYCAYPLHDCASVDSLSAFRAVCGAHSTVVPAESYAPATEEERQRIVAELQQKALALEHEVEIRRRVERLLADRERELADFLENGLHPMHRAGPDGTILWANRAELALLGYEPSEYVGHNIADFHADKQAIARILARLADGEALRDHAAKVICKNGTVRNVLISSNALRENGKLVSTRCFTRDVTEQSSAQETMRERGAVMHLALQGARMGYFVADLDTGRVRASQQLAELLGMTFAFDWTLEAFLALMHPQDRENFRAAFARTISGRGDFVVEFRVRRELSDFRWFEGRGEAVYDQNGRAVRFYGVCADVTNRKREGQMLAHLAAVVDSADDAIISKNLDGIVQSWNKGATRIFGYEADEAIGRPITMLIPPELMHEEATILAKIRAGERLEHYMTTRVAKDGTRRLVSLGVSPIRDSTGKIVGASKIAREIQRIDAVTGNIPLGPGVAISSVSRG